jgi:hypothetical protein
MLLTAAALVDRVPGDREPDVARVVLTRCATLRASLRVNLGRVSCDVRQRRPALAAAVPRKSNGSTPRTTMRTSSEPAWATGLRARRR